MCECQVRDADIPGPHLSDEEEGARHHGRLKAWSATEETWTRVGGVVIPGDLLIGVLTREFLFFTFSCPVPFY